MYYKCSSSTISIQDGEDTGQSIWHFHAHVIPRTKGDITNNDLIYAKLQVFDDEFIKEYTELQKNVKNQIELNEEIDKIRTYFSKVTIN
jgi:bis(5'-adenosyl)-triphosphatase